MRPLVVLWLFAGLALPNSGNAENFSLEEVVQRVVDNHGALEVANLQVDRALLERPKVESQLGWMVNGRSGLSHDVSFIGTPSDRLDLGGGAERRLLNGATLGVNGNYGFEDSSLSFSPQLPNPSHATTIDLNYRMPLRKGRGNPDYAQGLASAEAGVALAKAGYLAQRDQLARQAIDLYYGLALTYARILNAKQGIERAERLRAYIHTNADLGLAENKDLLQVKAQLSAQTAEHRALEVAWEQQRTALNRLMGRDWNELVMPDDTETVLVDAGAEDFETVLNEVEENSPELQQLRGQVQLAEAAIARARDAGQDTLDAVFSVGTRTRSGDSAASGSVSEQDLAGIVTVEYRRAADKRGFDAQIAQAQLDRSIALQQIQLVKENLRYQVAGLLAEITAVGGALDGYKVRLVDEEGKLSEAEARHRTGRADTRELIQFESELYFTQLAVQQNRIDLARKRATLDLLRGRLWKRVVPVDVAEKGAQ